MRGRPWRSGALALAIALAALAVALFVGAMVLTPGPTAPDPPLDSVLLDERGLGAIEPSFQPLSSRFTDEDVPLPEWIPDSVQRVVRIPTLCKEWGAPDHSRAVRVVGHRLQLTALASAVIEGILTAAGADAVSEFVVPDVPNARGFVKAPNGPQDPARRYLVVLQRGTLVVQILVIGSDSAGERDLRLAQRLMEAQAAKTPEAPSAPVPSSDAEVAVWSAAGMLTALLTYLGLASLAARVADPLRRTGRFPTDRAGPAPTSVIDVTLSAARQHRAARARMVLELAGIAVAAPGVFPFTWPLGLVAVAAGAAMACLAGTHRRRDPMRPGHDAAFAWHSPRASPFSVCSSVWPACCFTASGCSPLRQCSRSTWRSWAPVSCSSRRAR